MNVWAGKAILGQQIISVFALRGDNQEKDMAKRFSKEYNARTANQLGDIIPVVSTFYDDKSFTFILKTPPASEVANNKQQLKKALKKLEKKEDELIEKVMRENKQKENNLKRQKLEKKEKGRKGNNTLEATTSDAAPDSTAPNAAPDDHMLLPQRLLQMLLLQSY
ncbi:PREDICTED: uncharacterized protein LOC104728802 [Camelina sativa]|uniref:Uncharacterized protein LOC104728802 n=1 Tax=Camelina sativa TaxID=90675 RepID=A0ABM1QLI4_CAMSA|nr:PREDICTED: uncharacterized protein LOC104728802 [Camelina sativa]